MKLVSIIIPTCNRESLLKHCINSVYAQTYPNIECIVVDDGSTDNTIQAVKEIQRNCSKIKYIQNGRSKGAPGARNTGFEQANGTYIQFLDSDDCIHPRKIEMQVQALEKDDSLDMVYCLDEYFFVNSSDNFILWNVPNEVNDIDRFLFDDLTFHTASPLWRKSVLIREKLIWDESLICWQDWDFHLKALIRGIKYFYIPKVLNYIRDHDGFRSTSYSSLLKEQSKLNAAASIFNELERCGNLTRERKKYLTTFVFNVLSNMVSTDINTFDNRSIAAGYELLQKINNKKIVCSFLYFLQKLSLIPLKEYMKIVRRVLQIPSFPSNTWKQVPSIQFRMMG